MILTKVVAEPVVRDAIAAIAAAVLPCAMLEMPVMCSMLLPIVPLCAFQSTLLLVRTGTLVDLLLALLFLPALFHFLILLLLCSLLLPVLIPLLFLFIFVLLLLCPLLLSVLIPLPVLILLLFLSIFVLLVLLLCVGRSVGSDKQEQNCCNNHSNWFHGIAL